MPLNVENLLHRPARVTRQTYTTRDTILYALGIGAGIPDPTDRDELRFLNEKNLLALPTMAVILAAPPFWLDDPEIGMDWRKVLNAGQEMILDEPIPISGDVSTTLRIDALWDKGPAKGALMQSSRDVRDFSGKRLATIKQTHILRGNGGFGGQDQPKASDRPLPITAPDLVVDLQTRPEQALIYRLSGDYNPLHIDPDVATAGGFPKPILHGACTFGITGRAILRALAGNDPARLRRFGGRYSRPVFPGDTIRTEIWGTGTEIQFRAKALERDIVVFDRGFAEVI